LGQFQLPLSIGIVQQHNGVFAFHAENTITKLSLKQSHRETLENARLLFAAF
jgi:hypothetical protein